MKLRTKRYLNRKKALQEMIQFKDLRSFLKAGFAMSRSIVVKKDIINTLLQLNDSRQAVPHFA